MVNIINHVKPVLAKIAFFFEKKKKKEGIFRQFRLDMADNIDHPISDFTAFNFDQYKDDRDKLNIHYIKQNINYDNK